MRYTALLVLLVLWAAPRALADEPPTPKQVADQVLEAVAAGDKTTLTVLAETDEPDPWHVADELSHRGEHDAAEALARSSGRPHLAALPAYITARRASPADEESRTLRQKAEAAWVSRDEPTAIALAAKVEAPFDTVDRIRLLYVHGLALQKSKRHVESAAAFERAAVAAQGLGWKARAAHAFYEVGMSTYAARSYPAALAAWKASSALMSELGQYANAAATLNNVGAMSEALGLLEEALEAFEASRQASEHAGDADSVLTARRYMASIQRTRGRYKEALVILETALRVERERGNTAGTAAASADLASLSRLTGEYDRAKQHAEAALRAYESVDDKTGVANALVQRAALLRIEGDHDAAATDLDRAKTIFDSSGDREGMAAVLNGMATLHKAQGRPTKALETYERANVLAREAGDRRAVGRNLNNIGLVHLELGDYDRALTAYRDSLEIKRAMRDRRGIANTLNNIALVYKARGQFEEAIRLFQDSLAIKQAIGNKPGAARTLDNIGSLYVTLGRHGEAMRHLEASLAAEKALGRPKGIARVQNSMGNAYKSLGKSEQAVPLYESALATWRAMRDKPSISATLMGLAGAFVELDDRERARACIEEALSLAREMGNRPQIAVALHNLGRILVDERKFDEALARYDEALAIETALGGTSRTSDTLLNQAAVYRRMAAHEKAEQKYRAAIESMGEVPVPGTQARCLWGLSWVRLAQGRNEDAIARAREAVALITRLSRGLAESEGAGARDVFAGVFEVGLLASARSGDIETLAWFFEQGRSGSLREALHGREALQAILPDTNRKALADARAEETRALAAYRRALESGKRKPRREAKRELEEAQAHVEAVITGIQRDAKAAAAIVLPAPDDLATIESHLRPGEVLVYYGLTWPDALALVVRSDSARMVPLGSTESIQAAADQLLLDEHPMVDPAAASALRTLIVDPLELDADVTRVLVSPMGSLGYVPFVLLFPRREVAYVPSGTTYGLLRSDAAKRGKHVLGLGDPDYKTVVDETALALHRGGTSARLPRLPATRVEVEAIADESLLDTKATEAGFRSALDKRARWRAVHFACHGLIKPEQPTLSALALTANKDSDGLLTCLEIFRLKIPSDLVVLSACETGRGKIYQTEGIVGLTNAFMFAGSPRVIASLWKVDDAATQALMVKFYELWNGEPDLGAADALRQAQAFVRSHEKWKHPYYWAAWVLWGLPD